MRSLSLLFRRGGAFTAFIVMAFSLCTFAAPQIKGQEKDKPKTVEVSDGESKLGEQINKAPDAAAKLTAAEALIKKYPKTSLRPQIVQYLSGQIIAVPDPSQRITLSERYLALFPDTTDALYVAPALVDSYITAQRLEDAFRSGSAWLAKSPDDVRVLTMLAFHGRNDPKFAQQAKLYLPKAVELFEAGAKPAALDQAQFDQYKKAWMPQLYQIQGLHALTAGNPAEAIARVQKAVAINPNDPVNYYIIGSAKNEEYHKMAAEHQAMVDLTQKSALMTKINAQLDEIIDYYARTLALSEVSPQHKALHDQVLGEITPYYKFRHDGSTDGMQQLIDKHKKQTP
jgi:tetratricopeptide (TPR) repeat protein